MPKDAATTRPSGRAARKEQALFDINPRAAWEFLSRAKSEKGEEGVKFQQEDEEFTQWKEEEEKAAVKIEVVPTAPTSFADALLRKLNMKSDSNSNGLKGEQCDGVGGILADSDKAPAKPRLVSRTNEAKSPWKYHKIPTVPSLGVPTTLKPLFSCMLWRLHESEKNPLVPEKFVLLAGNKDIHAMAEKLGIPVAQFSFVKLSLLETKSKFDNRMEVGELEASFPEATAASERPSKVHSPEKEVPALTGSVEDLGLEQKVNEIVEELKPNISNGEELQILPSPENQINGLPGYTKTDSLDEKPAMIESSMAITYESTTTKPKDIVIDEAVGLLSKENPDVYLAEPKAPPTASKSGLRSPMQLSRPSTATGDTNGKDESELDSDEEIIVFNPRARRASGKKLKDASRSRPGTSGGLASKVLKSSPKELSSQSGKPADKSSRDKNVALLNPKLINGFPHAIKDESVEVMVAKLKPKIESTLKPESPVFTPGKPFVQVSQGEIEAPKPVPSTELVKASPPKNPALPTNPRNGPPRQPRAAMQQRNPSQEKIRLQRENQQRESERMIQRQREAIQRRAKVVEKPVKKTTPEKEKEEEKLVEKPPPRQVQMEPTSNPTVIDPDAFDRSYVVQPSTSSPNTNSSTEKRRPRGHQHRGSGIRRGQGSPKRRSKTPEPEIDYVLKSGAPRASVRGKGKLWIP